MILEQRRISTGTLGLEAMQTILSLHDDFKNALETMLTNKGHTALFLPKFHCELKGIEKV